MSQSENELMSRNFYFFIKMIEKTGRIFKWVDLSMVMFDRFSDLETLLTKQAQL